MSVDGGCFVRSKYLCMNSEYIHGLLKVFLMLSTLNKLPCMCHGFYCDCVFEEPCIGIQNNHVALRINIEKRDSVFLRYLGPFNKIFRDKLTKVAFTTSSSKYAVPDVRPETIYDGCATHTLSMRECVLMSIIYSLHLYNILHSISKDIIPSSNPMHTAQWTNHQLFGWWSKSLLTSISGRRVY